jgi:hypothetical protein
MSRARKSVLRGRTKDTGQEFPRLCHCAWRSSSRDRRRGQQPAAPAADPIPTVLQNYQLVPPSGSRIPKRQLADDRRTYDGWGYARSINTPANVSRLRPVWGFSTGD